MKPLVFVLAGLFLPLQTFYWLDCCCGPLCSTPGELCKDHDHHSRSEKPCRACGEHSNDHSSKTGKLPGKDKRCTHIAPTTELSQPQLVDVVHAPQVELFVVDLPGLVIDEPARLPMREDVPRPGPKRRPLYLLDSAFLI
jgi:hypothetical protein